MQTAEDDRLRAEVASGCRVLGNEGVTRSTFGHVSARTPDGRIFIKARGPGEQAPRYVGDADVIEIDGDCNVLAGGPGLEAPLEAPIHTALYAARADIGSVIHVHPRWVVALAAAGLPLDPLYGAYDPAGFSLAVDGVPTYPESMLIDSPELGAEVAAAMGDRRACVLHGHGIVTVGPDVASAVTTAIALDELARLTVTAAAAAGGGPITGVSPESADRLLDQLAGHMPSGPIPGPKSSAWRYYQRRADEARPQSQ